MTTSPAGQPVCLDQPVSRVEWVPRGQLSANSWNPNVQAPPEYKLLKVSLLENGWTQPIVVRETDGRLEIVDGFHRWRVSENAKVAAMTGGLVPIVRLEQCAPDVARMATIRHNRARGTHHVLKMADIVAELLTMGLEPDEIGARLQMDPEEVERLADRGEMIRRGSQPDFGKGWTV